MTTGSRTGCCQVIFDLRRIQSSEVRGWTHHTQDLQERSAHLSNMICAGAGPFRAPGGVEHRTPELLELGGLGRHSHRVTERKLLEAKKHFRLLAVFVNEPRRCDEDVWMVGECSVVTPSARC